MKWDYWEIHAVNMLSFYQLFNCRLDNININHRKTLKQSFDNDITQYICIFYSMTEIPTCHHRNYHHYQAIGILYVCDLKEEKKFHTLILSFPRPFALLVLFYVALRNAIAVVPWNLYFFQILFLLFICRLSKHFCFCLFKYLILSQPNEH